LKSGVVWDQELYNCLINCCARALPVNELSRLFNEMLQRGFNPNTITFNDMLGVYAKAELFNKARELFMMARKRGLVDVLSYIKTSRIWHKPYTLCNLMVFQIPSMPTTAHWMPMGKKVIWRVLEVSFRE
jgi:pentatricopeptide repeat protein